MIVSDMQELLERLGIEIADVTGNEIRAHCPGHKERKGKEDSNPSWFINADTGAHICFSCHFKGGLAYLIGYTQGYYGPDGMVDFEQAKVWLGGQESLSSLFNRAMKDKEPESEPEPVDPAMLFAFTTPPRYALQSRGISVAAADEYDLRWDERRESWIIPIFRGFDQQLLGWQEKAYQGRFFMNYPKGVKKSESLFGYGNSADGPTIVVESPLDAVRLRSLGFNGVAVYGSYISTTQINLIKSDSLLFAFDNDEAGWDANRRVQGMMRDLGFEGWFFNYSQTDQKDVGGMSRDEIMLGLTNARHTVSLLQGA